MLGFFVAIGMELSTSKSVWTQVAGKYVDEALVDSPVGAATLFFGAVVVATTFATFAPMVYSNGKAEERSVGPFTPRAELANGRAAMMGFLALLVVEGLKGNTPLF